jgi:hypothetical protein
VGRERLLWVGLCKEQRAASQKRAAILTRIGRHAMLAGKEISSFMIADTRLMAIHAGDAGRFYRCCKPFCIPRVSQG